MLTKLFSSHPKQKPFLLLDVGTGNFAFPERASALADEYGVTIEPFGVSASEMRQFAVEDDHYQICNIDAGRENAIISSKKYHFITAIQTMNWMSDPLGTICYLYSLLEDHGILFVDHVAIYGLYHCVEQWMAFLHVSGYKIMTGYDRALTLDSRASTSPSDIGWLTFLLIEKTHPTLDLKVFYNTTHLFASANRCIYNFGTPLTKEEIETVLEYGKVFNAYSPTARSDLRFLAPVKPGILNKLILH